MTYNIASLEELERWVHTFLGALPFQKDTATIITLSGDLGVGKTSFVKCCAQYFGITDDVTSPTFVIQKEYDIQKHSYFKKLTHIDAYRLESSADLEYLRWSDTIQEKRNIIFCEWPEMVEGVFLPNHISIHIAIGEGASRIITVLENS